MQSHQHPQWLKRQLYSAKFRSITKKSTTVTAYKLSPLADNEIFSKRATNLFLFLFLIERKTSSALYNLDNDLKGKLRCRLTKWNIFTLGKVSPSAIAAFMPSCLYAFIPFAQSFSRQGKSWLNRWMKNG